jgi:hypothetical protein
MRTYVIRRYWYIIHTTPYLIGVTDMMVIGWEIPVGIKFDKR